MDEFKLTVRFFTMIVMGYLVLADVAANPLYQMLGWHPPGLASVVVAVGRML